MTPLVKLSPTILPDSVGQSNPASTTPMQYFKGVGPARAQLLASIGIVRPEDLLTYFPRQWEDRRLRFTIREVPIGEKTTLKGMLKSVEFTQANNGLGMAFAELEDATGRIQAVWFKKLQFRYDVFATLRQQLQPGRTLIAFGSVEWGPRGRQLRVDDSTICANADGTLTEEERFHFDRIVPLYTVPDGLQERLLRTLVGRALRQGVTSKQDSAVPSAIVQRLSLPSLAWCLEHIHFPDTLVQKEEARRRLAFEEFFQLEIALGLMRRLVKKDEKSHAYALKRSLLTPFREKLGFEFTAAQKRVIREIFDDLMQPHPMNRLLQGDVGSGKTVVALSAMLLAVENGGQAALMAPTEILAEQHALTLARFLNGLPVRLALLTRSQTPAEKKKILQRIAQGEVDIVIGTHALIQKSVRFHRLMLAVIDEQHRFGVEHRSLLREKGPRPDVLVMTATPIPRTLALTLYGDLDISTIDHIPPGRSPIQTLHAGEEEAYATAHAAIGRGEQAYIVYPLVEESDKIELKAAVQEAEALRKTIFHRDRVGVLHGQLPARQKDAIMEEFRRGKLDILIATSIVEVGIDVPNATVMMIHHAERFGLSTLHQLRGRIGRGVRPSVCLLIADLKSAEARRRIDIMVQTADGFRLSEEDLSMRGPGEILGAAQHGVPEFKMGNLVLDAALLQQARATAETVLREDPRLALREHAVLKRSIMRDYAAKWPLGMTA